MRIASISYDSVETLGVFGKRVGITYPMLADPGSRLIRQFRMVDPDNSEDNVPSYGMKDTAYPGYFVVDPSGVVTERFIDERYDDRRTGNAVVASMFPELLETKGPALAAPHLQVRLGQTDSLVNLGAHLKLLVDVTLPRGMHIYARGVQNYRPVELTFDESEWFKVAVPEYPRSRTMHLKAIKESVPVYEGAARFTVDLVLANTTRLMRRLSETPGTPRPVTVNGRLRYQACDATVCYLPSEVALKWDLLVKLPDRTRAEPVR